MARRNASFDDRLARIASGGVNTFGTVYIGPQDRPAAKGRGGGGSAVLLSLLTTPIVAVLGFVAGMAGVAFARYFRFHAAGIETPADDALTLLAVDAGIAVFAALTLRNMLRLKSAKATVSVVVGIAAMLGAMHNFVHVSPDRWEAAFSPEWVAQVVDTTRPGTLVFGTETVELGEMSATLLTGETPIF